MAIKEPIPVPRSERLKVVPRATFNSYLVASLSLAIYDLATSQQVESFCRSADTLLTW